jgi:hypothetical protein
MNLNAKRGLEAKRRSDGWLSDEVGYGAICHDSTNAYRLN